MATEGIIFSGALKPTALISVDTREQLSTLYRLSLAEYLGATILPQVGDSIGSIAVKSDAWHHRSDAITSAFAFAGVSIALVGGERWAAADRWAVLGAALVILFNAWRQLRPAIL